MSILIMIKKSIIHIAFLGPQGSYSHIAAIQYANFYFNKKFIEYSCQRFNDIFTVVERHQAEYGIIPIENSNSGFIDEVCDLLLDTQLVLVGEITIPIKHCILANKNTSLNKVQFIYSHPQPVQQCSKFLKHFSEWKIILCESSSAAIKKVAKLNQSNLAALGSFQGGFFYGLQPLLLPQNLSNQYKNTTRFIILKNTKIDITNTNTLSKKTMINISVEQKSEKLYTILKILKFYNIKITFLKSRKLLHTKTKSMAILIELVANLNDTYTQKALIKLRNISYSLKILGCYPSIINKNILDL